MTSHKKKCYTTLAINYIIPTLKNLMVMVAGKFRQTVKATLAFFFLPVFMFVASFQVVAFF
jgi:hypothetical protein